MLFSIHYTLDEARALLPQVRQWLETLESRRDQLNAAEERVKPLLAQHDDIGGSLANAVARGLADCKSCLREFSSRQIQIKNLERGLIDFPSLREGQEVFLCWEKDDPDIEFWHDIESGYAGRERL